MSKYNMSKEEVKRRAGELVVIITASITLADALHDGCSTTVLNALCGDLIKNGHAIVERNRWVNCATRAPEKKKLVDFVVGNDAVCCGYLHSDNHWRDLEDPNVTYKLEDVSVWRDRPIAPADTADLKKEKADEVMS